MKSKKQTWLDIIVELMDESGGSAKYQDLYPLIQDRHPSRLTKAWQATVRRTIEDHSSDSANFRGNDIFYSVDGRGNGIWGLRNFNPVINPTSLAIDLVEKNESLPERRAIQVYRIIRDTKVSQWVKKLYSYQCQICAYSINLPNGEKYAEAHHIKPLGNPHNGFDVKSNVICVCPNHHAELDYGAITLDKKDLNIHDLHNLDDDVIEYHNQYIVSP